MLAACGSSADDLVDPTEDFAGALEQLQTVEEPLKASIQTWLNQIGLAQFDPDLWTARLDLACEEGVWDDEVAGRLAAGFVLEDESVSVRSSDAGPVDQDAAAQALWIMAVNHCRGLFPEGEIEQGPPPLGG